MAAMRPLMKQTQGIFGSPLRNLAAVLALVMAVGTAATLAYMAAGWSLSDASYMVLLTLYTVGYDEVRPIDTAYLRGVTIATMVLGCTGMILLTSVLVQIVTVIQLRQFFGTNRMQARIDKLSGHVIICGFGRIGSTLAHDLRRARVPFVIVDHSEDRLADASAADFCCLEGDATDEDILAAAGVRRARALATVLPDDAANVFITLSARSLNPQIEIFARGQVPPTERKLRRAGADHVVLPAHIGAERIARMILFPATEDLAAPARLAALRAPIAELGLDLERATVAPGSAIAGMTVGEAERLAAGRLMIVQINREAGSVARPGPDEPIEPGNELLVLLRDAGEAAQLLLPPGETPVAAG